MNSCRTAPTKVLRNAGSLNSGLGHTFDVRISELDNLETSGSPENLIELTAEIVSAYVANNRVPPHDISSVIETVHASLQLLGKPVLPVAEKPVPRIPIKKTVTPDYIISLEDGKHYKSLKRHLSGYGMSPQEYKEKWGLPHDYPMVASSYAAHRSELAKSIGLGRKKEVAPEPAPTPKKTRGKKVEAEAA